MRIFNAKKSTLTIPLVGSNQKITIAPKSPSGDFMPNKELLSLLITSFDYDEIALIVSGPYEISMCSQVSGCVGFVANSLEEAIERFSPKSEIKVAENPANLKSEEKPAPEPEPVSETVAPAPVEESVKSEEVAPNPSKKTVVRRYRKKKEE